MNWHTLNKTLHEYTEAQVQAMLEQEKVGKRRQDILRRLHQRYNALRVARERKELLT